MQKRRLILMLGLLTAAGTAQANCTYYQEDGPIAAPTFEICYKGVCDVTALAYECSDPDSFEVGFDVGWSTKCDLESAAMNQCPIFWEGRKLPQRESENITCSPLSGDTPCNFP